MNTLASPVTSHYRMVIDLRWVDSTRLMGMLRDPGHPASETKAFDSRPEKRAADRVEHHIRTAPIGELEHRLAEVIPDLVSMKSSTPSGLRTSATIGFAPRPARDIGGGLTDQPSSTGDQDRLAGHELH